MYTCTYIMYIYIHTYIHINIYLYIYVGIEINGNDGDNIDNHDHADGINNKRDDSSDISHKNGSSTYARAGSSSSGSTYVRAGKSSSSNTNCQNDRGNNEKVRSIEAINHSNDDGTNISINKTIANDNTNSSDTTRLEGYLDTPTVSTGYLPQSNDQGTSGPAGAYMNVYDYICIYAYTYTHV
jgi:hypothetical protein